jgi:inhibitor of KinA sporulation pathway (predicted exonuclease)
MARDLSKILVIDIEASCWLKDQQPPGESSEVIEFGCALVSLTDFSIVKKQSILVKPQFSKISPFCTELTTITQELLDEQGVPFSQALEILKKEFKPRDLSWASYGDYDRVQIDRNCELYNIANPFGRTHINVKNVFAIKNKLSKEVGLGQALDKLGLKFEGVEHRGIWDAINIVKILKSVLGN